MAGKIFISYRREDSAAHALNVAHYLGTTFGKQNIFIDIDRMRAGQKFPAVLESSLGQCKVMLAVIGPNGLNALNEETKARRLDTPDDWVRLELERALARGIPLIPVLVGGAKLPARSELPATLQPLVDHHFATLTTNGFRHEMAGLAGDIATLMGRRRWGKAVATTLLTTLLLAMAAGSWWHFVHLPAETARLTAISAADRRANEAEKVAGKLKAAEQERIAREEATRRKAEEERLAHEKAERERLARVEREKAEQKKANDDRLAREKAEQERLARVEREKAEQKKANDDRLAREKAEQERLARVEREKVEQKKANDDRLAREKVEQDRIAALKKAEDERRAEQERIARVEREKAEQKKADDERRAREKAEQDRIAALQKAEDERRAEQERLAQLELQAISRGPNALFRLAMDYDRGNGV
ncbi:MAG: TIR domain-containing protein [Hyphomicrobiaceae bacterium]